MQHVSFKESLVYRTWIIPVAYTCTEHSDVDHMRPCDSQQHPLLPIAPPRSTSSCCHVGTASVSGSMNFRVNILFYSYLNGGKSTTLPKVERKGGRKEGRKEDPFLSHKPKHCRPSVSIDDVFSDSREARENHGSATPGRQSIVPLKLTLGYLCLS